MYFLTGSWTYKQSFPSSYGAKVGVRAKKDERGRGRGEEKRRGNSPLPLYSSLICSHLNFLDERHAGYCGWGGGGGLRYTCLPFITGLFIWGLAAGLSETGTVSTDLLGSFVLPACELGGDPTKVKRTLDTELWKNVVQFGTLGYFTSETKNVCFQYNVI